MKAPKFNVEAECNFLSVQSSDFATCCYYEYLRESAALRRGMKDRKEPLNFPLVSQSGVGRLVLTLGYCDYPTPWNCLSEPQRDELRLLLPHSMTPAQRRELHARERERSNEKDRSDYEPLPPLGERNLKQYPPVLILDVGRDPWDCSGDAALEALKRLYGSPRFDELETFPLESGRSYVFGVIRLDEDAKDFEAIDAFKAYLAKRKRIKRTDAGSKGYAAKLSSLAALRIRHRFPREQWQPLLHQHIGGASYKVPPHQLSDDARITETWEKVLSRSCQAAIIFFESLFPGESPIHRVANSGKTPGNLQE